jgi:hypothetical protein
MDREEELQVAGEEEATLLPVGGMGGLLSMVEEQRE